MTPDKPFTIAVCIVCSILSYLLPTRYALLPLALAIACYPNNLMLPPDNLGLTAQRIIAIVLFMRCLTTPAIRRKFKWGKVDTVALIYFLLLTISQIITQGPGKALNNRGGFFLGTMAPFWCVRMLITDRESFFALLKAWIWGAFPLAIFGIYQFLTGDHPYYAIMQYGMPKIDPSLVTRLVDMRMMFGSLHFRANCPFLQCIMFGWFFSLLLAWGTSLFWEKKSYMPWGIAWGIGLPAGIISAIAGGPIMMAAMSLGFLALFPFRKSWRMGLAIAGLLIIIFCLVSRKNPMELMAGMGFDQGSSWYRVGLNSYTINGGMNGHWIAGYGEIPANYSDGRTTFHDLCIHWVYMTVLNGLMGMVSFYGLCAICGWQLWNASKKANGLADEWILWSLLSTLAGSLWAMLVVALFGEMQVIYHMFLAVVANAPMFVGATTRRVGLMAQVDGKPVMLVYHLKPGQKLALMTPEGGQGGEGAVVEEGIAGDTIPVGAERAVPAEHPRKGKRRK